jgi:predicted nucleotidyltransferase component of viral defense system
MIASGLITQRAELEQMPAQTIERDYVLAHVCAEIGIRGDARIVFKGGTLLRLCYFEHYRYSADLDFSTVEGLSKDSAIQSIAEAAESCRERLEMPMLEVSQEPGEAAWVNYVGPLRSKPRKLKLDVSDSEFVESRARVHLQRRWPDLLDEAMIDCYTLDEVSAEKVRCIAERLQCRDFYDMHELLQGEHVDSLEAWELYLRKSQNDRNLGKRRTPPSEWLTVFERRMGDYERLWKGEMNDYVAGAPSFEDVRRVTRRKLAPLLKAAGDISS